MFDSLLDVLPELLYSFAAGALALTGITAELTAVRTLAAGDQVVGVWMVFMGALALYAGAMVARDRALPALRSA
jgi:phosphate/sulfate permease